MKKIPFLIILWVLLTTNGAYAPVFLFAEDALLVYSEGEVDFDRGRGRRIEAMIGDLLAEGESVITGRSGYAEMERGSSTMITVKPDTIFTLEKTGDAGDERDVLRCTFGSISYRFEKLSGKEPYLVTPGAIAGVRGTEVTVSAAEDGSSLFVVESGLVEVEAEGETVLLEAEEGVEVRPGEPPGEKFEVKRGRIDYARWQQQRSDAFLEDPLIAVQGVERRFMGFVKKVEELVPVYAEHKRWLDYEREEMKKVLEKEGEEARNAYYDEHVFPLEVKAHNSYITLRYWAKSALSLRRYVLGRMYLTLKTSYLTEPDNPGFRNFLEVYERILQSFESDIVPRLVDADLI